MQTPTVRAAGPAMILAISAAALFSGAPVRAQMASGAGMVNTCFSCHGTDGVSAGEMPTIAGKSQDFIVEKLLAYRSGEAESTVMGRITKGFSDAEIAELAKYFSAQ